MNSTELLSGLAVSVLGSLIAWAITRNPRASGAAFLGLLAVVFGIVALYRWFRAPYDLADVQWSITDEAIQVTGLLLERNTRNPVPGKPVRVEIFQAEQRAPFKGPGLPTTDASGRFVVTFDRRDLKQETLYLINTAYKHGRKWKSRDFEVASGGRNVPSPRKVPSQVSIGQPLDGQEVDDRNWVRGQVSDATNEVQVLVHPLQADSWWVQPVPKVASDGKWESLCFFGEGPIGRGEQFEILAIASPIHGLVRRGQQLQLAEIAVDVAKSAVVRVRRR